MPPFNLLFNSIGSELNRVRTFPLYVWQTVYIMYPHTNSCVPPAARGERTYEEVDTLCCQVGVWEDKGESAECACLISLFTTSLRDLQTCLSARQSWS